MKSLALALVGLSILVGVRHQMAPAVAEAPASWKRSDPLLVAERMDVSRASVVDLKSIPGIGPHTARRILDAHTEVGPFASVQAIPGLRTSLRHTIEPFILFLDQPVSLNADTPERLATLPGIGPALAQRIINARPFHQVDDLQRVRGIGKKTWARISDRVAL